jgi:multisubunit Na+/H+ antiporter MnhB subunit
MFTIVGIIITIFGFITNSDSEMYQKSLNINVNIIMGLIMLVFGGIMLYFAARKNKRRIE